jgi:hypothetical protein
MTLRIKKETLRNLNNEEQNQVAGGMPVTLGACSDRGPCYTIDYGKCPTNTIQKGGAVCCYN